MAEALKILTLGHLPEQVTTALGTFKTLTVSWDDTRRSAANGSAIEADDTPWDIVLVGDFSTPEKLISVIHRLRSRGLGVPVLVISDPLDPDSVAETIRAGASAWIRSQDVNLLVTILQSVALSNGTLSTDGNDSEETGNLVERLLSATRKLNLMITREQDPDQMLQSACSTIVRTLGYSLAWIMVSGKNRIRVQSAGSVDPEAFQRFPKQAHEGEFPPCKGRWDASQRSSVILRPEIHCDLCPLAANDGSQHSVCIGIHSNLFDWGILSVAVPAGSNIDSREQTILRELAANIAAGLEIIEAERQRAEGEQRFKMIMDASADAVFVTDRKGRCVYVNTAAAELLGYSEEALMSMDIEDLTPSDEMEKRKKQFQQLLEAGHILTEFEILGKGGRSILTELNAVVLPNGMVYGSCRDLTPRRQAIEALRETSQRLQLAARAGNVGLWDWDLVTQHVHFSAEWKAQIGYGDDELQSSYEVWQSRLHPDDGPSVIQEVERSLVPPFPPLNVEFRFRHRDGSYRWILSQGQVQIGPGNTPTRMLGSHIDLTRAKEKEQKILDLERQFLHAQKMESMGLLAGGVAHDFNNLLMIILGQCDLMTDQLHAQDPILGDVEQIRDCAQRAADLTRQLLAFSRKQVLEVQTVKPSQLVSKLQVMLQRLIPETIHMELLANPESGWIRTDPGQLEQVMVNLVVNARDAMPHGGNLCIDVADVSFDSPRSNNLNHEVQPGSYVMLAVSDTGVGMDAETLSRAFEPFFTTKPEGKGTGLGLSTVYGIVKQTQGFLECESKVGTGTTFRAFFPRVEPATGHPEDVQASFQAAEAMETILVAEDNDGVRKLVSSILTNSGYTVLTASNGGEALIACQRHEGRIHLLVSDVVMPAVTGGELARELRAIQPGMKVLFMSGYSYDAVCQDDSNYEGFSFIQKPFSRQALLDKVRQALNAGRENT